MDATKMLTLWPALVTPFFLFLLYHVRHSLPFSWHIRVFLPMLLARRRAVTGSKGDYTKFTQGLPQLRHDSLSRGRDPFGDELTRSFTATIDDCDFMGHLSNSSYPKNLDVARLHYASTRFLQFSMDGGWVALGGIYSDFRNEIKVLKKYQVRSKILTWGDKWFYMKNEFISTGKDGKEILHCLCITKHCCKIGRKTVPPWFALAYSGYTSRKTFNQSDNFNKAQDVRLRLQKIRKSDNPLKAFIPLQKRDGPLAMDQQWMTEEYWNMVGWEEGRLRGMQELNNFIADN